MSQTTFSLRPIWNHALCALIVSLLIACGGGSGGGSTATNTSNNASNSGGSTGADGSFQDPLTYSASGGASLSVANEGTAITQHTIKLGTETIAYTASAGHIVARSPGNGQNKAAFFYVAYTANNQAAQTRPITFFYNGGPGSDTVWLHLGSFGPKRLATGLPSTSLNGQFAMVDNAESLLSVSDLVFVNAIGTGYSQAVAPFSNASFWGVDEDAAAFRDFVTRYLEVNKRQASPKYLYGESYGGTRTGVLSALLEVAGVHLDAVILQSPALNYNDDCTQAASAFCGVDFPTYAAVASYFDAAPSANKNLPEYMQAMRQFNATSYGPAVYQVSYQNQAVPTQLTQQLAAYAGLSPQQWATHFNMNPVYYRSALKPGYQIGRLDARVIVPSNSPLAANGDASFDYIKASFASTISTYLRDQLKYMNSSSYVVESNAISSWNFRHGGQAGPDVIPDLAAALRINPQLRILNINGYHDLATTFHWSELELSRLATSGNIIIRNYPGGHMTYLDDATRLVQYQDLQAFYRKTLPVVQSSLPPSFANLSSLTASPPMMASALPPMPSPEQFLSTKPYGWRPMLFGAKMQHVDLDHAVEQNLRHLFQAAAPSSARLSRDQLRAAGLGAALEHFDAIDVTHRGSISADEWLAYLRRRPQK